VGESYYVKTDDEGKCLALRKEGDKWLCSAGTDKPFQCLEDPLVEGCNIKRKVVRPK
jgi:hypothetical protein